MADSKGPSLEQLGLDQPTKFTHGKISIESLQRQSDMESMSARTGTSYNPEPRNQAMDMMAGILSLILPGSGHLLKGRPIAGAAWFILLVVSYLISLAAAAIFFIFGLPFFLVTIVMHIICIARAMKA